MPKKYTKKEFVKLARKKHGRRYCYKKTEYTNGTTPVTITCEKHGDFVINRAKDHYLSGRGCQICSASAPERFISEFFIEKRINFNREVGFSNLFLGMPLRFDFEITINSKKILIEYHGEHHFKKNSSWCDDKKFKHIQDSDVAKREFCNKNKIEYLELNCFDDEEKIIKKLEKICKIKS